MRPDPLNAAAPTPDDSSGSDGAASSAAGAEAVLPALAGYEMIALLGRGGMGMVYEAYQRATGRRVAVKFMLDAAGASASARQRFEREVELVARLQHPHIVSVLDSGVHSGRYFYVMEYIAGRPLDQWILDFGLGILDFKPGREATPQSKIQNPKSKIEEALRLLAAIADAVDHAHQHGVLHRDLKPSNVLIDERGEPHLLDFGLAKAFDPGSSAGPQASLSEPGQILGTLGYMPPEQSRGQFDKLSVRGDVYSLGAIGYELVAGRLPCDVNGPLAEVLRRIAEQDPPPPSAVRRGVGTWERGKVGTEEKEGHQKGWRRYVPAFPRSHVLTDLDAILLKALDKSPERRYATAAEFAADLRRHLNHEPVLARPASAWYQFRKFARRNRAMVGGAATALGLLLLGVIGTGWQAWRATAAEKLATQERDEARLARDQARQEADKATAVRDFLQTMFRSANPDSGVRRDVTVKEALDLALPRVGQKFAGQPAIETAIRSTIGQVYLSQGFLAEAEAQLQTAYELGTRRLSPDAFETLDARIYLATAYLRLGRSADAEALLRAAIETGRRALGAEHPVTLLAESYLGIVFLHAGRLEEAAAQLRQTLARQRRALGEENDDALYTQLGLADTLRYLGDRGGAEPLLRHAFDRLQRTLGPQHPRAVNVLTSLADLVYENGNLEEAEKTYRQALEGQRRAFGDEHPATLSSLEGLALVMHDLGRLAEAEKLCRQVWETRRRIMGETNPQTLTAQGNLASILFTGGKLAEAEPLMRQALEGQARIWDETHPNTLNLRMNLGKLLQEQGKLDEAETLHRQTLALQRRALGAEHPILVTSLNNLGETLFLRGQTEAAEGLFREALALGRKVCGPDHPDVANSLYNLAVCLQGRQEWAAAESLAREALAIYAQTLPAGHWFIARAEAMRGMGLLSLQRPEEAEPLLLRGYEVLRTTRGERDGLTQATLRALIRLYEERNQPDQAAEYRKKLPAVPPDPP